MDKIKWLVNNPNPCTACSQGSECCGCSAYTNWKEKFDSLNIDDATYEEARHVRMALTLKKNLERHLENISEEVKEEFDL